MKYFTSELLSKFNSESASERDQATVAWHKNMQDYSAIFATIETRISKKFMKIYRGNEGFHDFQLKKIELAHKDRGLANPVSIAIIIEGVHSYRITYKCVTKFIINYDEPDDDWMYKSGFDDWGYSEFLPLNEQTLSHEILFASGASILIHFRNRNIFVTKIS
jgi:hypothetical protein